MGADILGQIQALSVTQGMIPIDMSTQMYDMEMGIGQPMNDGAFLLLTNQIKKKATVSQIEFKVMDDTLLQREVPVATVVSAATASPIVFTVASGLEKQFQLYQRLQDLYTDEQLLVTNVNYTSRQITATRDHGYVTKSVPSITAGRILRVIGNTAVEGGTSLDGIAKKVDISSNYCSFVRTPYEMSHQMMNTKTYTGDEWARMGRKTAVEHRTQIENNILFSYRSDNGSGTPAPILDPIGGVKYLWTTGGIYQHIKNGNVFDLSGSAYGGLLTERAMDDAAEQFGQNSSGTAKKTIFCGLHFMSAMSQPLKNRLRPNTDLKEQYGLIVHTYTAACGMEYDIVPYPKMFTGYGTVTTTYGSMASKALVLDLPLIELVTMPNMDTKLWTQIQEPDRSGRKDEWRTLIGVRMRPGLDNPYNVSAANIQYLSPHGIITGFSSY